MNSDTGGPMVGDDDMLSKPAGSAMLVEVQDVHGNGSALAETSVEEAGDVAPGNVRFQGSFQGVATTHTHQFDLSMGLDVELPSELAAEAMRQIADHCQPSPPMLTRNPATPEPRSIFGSLYDFFRRDARDSQCNKLSGVNLPPGSGLTLKLEDEQQRRLQLNDQLQTSQGRASQLEAQLIAILTERDQLAAQVETLLEDRPDFGGDIGSLGGSFVLRAVDLGADDFTQLLNKKEAQSDAANVESLHPEEAVAPHLARIEELEEAKILAETRLREQEDMLARSLSECAQLRSDLTAEKDVRSENDARITAFAREVEQLRGAIHELNEQKRDVTVENDRLSIHVAGLEAKVRVLEQAPVARGPPPEELARAITDAEANAADARAEVDAMREELMEMLSRHSAAIAAAADTERLRQDHFQAEIRAAEAESQVSGLQVANARLQTEVERNRATSMASANDSEKLVQDHSRAEIRVVEAESRVRGLQQANVQLQAEVERTRVATSAAVADKEKLMQQRSHAEIRAAEAESHMRGLREANARLEADVQRTRRQMDACEEVREREQRRLEAQAAYHEQTATEHKAQHAAVIKDTDRMLSEIKSLQGEKVEAEGLLNAVRDSVRNFKQEAAYATSEAASLQIELQNLRDSHASVLTGMEELQQAKMKKTSLLRPLDEVEAWRRKCARLEAQLLEAKHAVDIRTSQPASPLINVVRPQQSPQFSPEPVPTKQGNCSVFSWAPAPASTPVAPGPTILTVQTPAPQAMTPLVYFGDLLTPTSPTMYLPPARAKMSTESRPYIGPPRVVSTSVSQPVRATLTVQVTGVRRIVR